MNSSNTTIAICSSLIVLSIFAIDSSSNAKAGYSNCKYSNTIERELSVDDIKLLKVVAGAGELEIKGDNRQNIKIEARLCSNNKEAIADMTVSDNVNDKIMHIETEFPGESLWGNDHQASIDLVLFVPKSMALNVKDSSGSVEIKDVASLDITDSSGELEIEDIAGDVIVVDSSGSIHIENIAGNVNVTDSSGNIGVRFVEQNFTVEVDSSGSIEASHIKGNMLVKVDSSGAIIANNIDGDFTVGKDSSGGIKHNKVNGRVNLPN